MTYEEDGKVKEYSFSVDEFVMESEADAARRLVAPTARSMTNPMDMGI